MIKLEERYIKKNTILENIKELKDFGITDTSIIKAINKIFYLILRAFLSYSSNNEEIIHYGKILLSEVVIVELNFYWINGYGDMKKDLVDILCCPVCKGDLELIIKKEDEKEILEGSLRCGKCDVDYPIENGIPNLLPPDEN